MALYRVLGTENLDCPKRKALASIIWSREDSHFRVKMKCRIGCERAEMLWCNALQNHVRLSVLNIVFSPL